MPFYEYTADPTSGDRTADSDPDSDSGCGHCRNRFTVLQRLSEPALTACPECGGPVRRVISSPNVVAGKSHMLRESSIEKAGFTQYRKIGKGVYEKTAGKKGPNIIKDD